MIFLFFILWIWIWILVWILHCNQKTHDQRCGIIDKIPHNDSYRTYFNDYNMVSYSAHFFQLLMFRDPYMLYSVRIRNLI